MEFAEFAARARAIEAETADLVIRDHVASLLRAAGDDLAIAARFVQGRVFPAWESRTVDIGPAYCYEAIARAAGGGTTVEDVEDRMADRGDVGRVAAEFAPDGGGGLAAFETEGQTVGDVYRELERLAEAEGSGSQDVKIDGLAGLLSRASPDEARYIARLVLGEMRIGVGGGTVRDAIALAFLVDDVQEPLDRFTPSQADTLAATDREPEGLDPDLPNTDAIDDAALDDAITAVERALQVTNDHGLVARVARDDGRDGLDGLHLRLGRPVDAMLAQTGTVADALDSWEAAAVEWKYDGARVQVHYGDLEGQATHRRASEAVKSTADAAGAAADGDPDAAAPEGGDQDSAGADRVRVFSRNMEDVTDALPEVVELATAQLDAPAILDGEVVAVDDDGRPRPFQDVLRRFRRKYDVEETREEVRLECYFFDCLHHAGDDLLDASLVERHDRLRTALSVGDAATDEDNPATGDTADASLADRLANADQHGVIPIEGGGVTALATFDDAAAIENVETAALEAGHEGVMLKNPEAAYTPGRRGKNWLKRKPDVETLDLVVTGAEWGEGRRADLFGTYELSVVTPDGYATVGHVATGLTDADLAELTERFEPLIRDESGQEVDIEPRIVFEVGYEEIQDSPATASGYALRFPRFLAVREDKDPADADTLERVERLADDG